MNLPTEVRYRPYTDWTDGEKTKIKENVGKSPWRASYHIEPETGLLNDPNGFLTLMVSSNFSIKVGHLEPLMV